MDENMKLIMAEFAKINTKLDNLDTRVSKLETVLPELEEIKDCCERLDIDGRKIIAKVADGFYRTKHQIGDLVEQWETLIKVLEYQKILPLGR